jgi:hypothetical protein
LDDTHRTAVESCPKALQALLSCSANNPIFELHKVIFVPVSMSRLPLQVEEQINTAILWPRVSYTHVFLCNIATF